MARKEITQDHIEKACVMMSEGKSLRAACREMGVNESAVRYHLTKDEKAFAQTAHARELGCDALADECIEISDSDIDPAHKRVMVETRLKLIGKWSQRYNDKITINSNSTVTHRYDLDSLPTERLDELERILADAAAGQGGEGEAQSPQLH